MALFLKTLIVRSFFIENTVSLKMIFNRLPLILAFRFGLLFFFFIIVQLVMSTIIIFSLKTYFSLVLISENLNQRYKYLVRFDGMSELKVFGLIL